jgi:hypothetical protein
MAMVTLPDNYVVFDHNAKRFLETSGATDQDLDKTKAYQQVIFSDFNAK